MSDTPEGSSIAARSAQEVNPDPPSSGGLFKRLAWAIAPGGSVSHENGAPQSNGTQAPRAANGIPLPGIGNLRHMRVEDVAIPKVEIVAVPSDISKADLVAVFRESGLTRLPVFEGTLDSPLGLVHLKDLALNYGFNGTSKGFALRPMLRPLLFAPPSMPLGVLLQKMQTERKHMALVIDEYGGTDGLLTIEDLIEQVIGEIEDEHDTEEEALWLVEKPGCYLAQAKAPLDEFEAEIGMRLATEEDTEEVDTLGGLVFRLTGRVPTRGEVVSHGDAVQFEVVDADPRRIKRLRVRVPVAADGAGATSPAEAAQRVEEDAPKDQTEGQ